jgi:ubiquinone/menaquinone biosynthesis C-methylase UbiE
MDRGIAAEPGATDDARLSRGVPVPRYLRLHYWWAYIHPWAVKFWDRLWIVNLILLTNYMKLRDAALKEFAGLRGRRVLQLACVYGDVTPKLARCVTGNGGTLDVVDVLPIQLRNVQRKLGGLHGVRLLNMDSEKIDLPSQHYDDVLLFFLLHEQPKAVRAQTLEQAFRVVKPGGRVLVVDFAKPYWWNPFRYLWCAFLAVFEPFALGLWWHPMAELVPARCRGFAMQEERYFGGLFQKTVIVCPKA